MQRIGEAGDSISRFLQRRIEIASTGADIYEQIGRRRSGHVPALLVFRLPFGVEHRPRQFHDVSGRSSSADRMTSRERNFKERLLESFRICGVGKIEQGLRRHLDDSSAIRLHIFLGRQH
ncbi:hypothetical protein [Methylosinus sp. LW3]|uniref:hypothetical protein n=1 Tax=Methylosinus sp. LW3 TaxID=107635 RepID=UPI0018DBEBB1|nr:hypothetical protein [Methylosinus sp. LW3]